MTSFFPFSFRARQFQAGASEARSTGLNFPSDALSGNDWGRLQAMNIVPVQDGGLALQWHLLSWPNPWFERFPLTLDQNLTSARSVQSDEASYWISLKNEQRKGQGGQPTCPQTNPLTSSASRIWDSAMVTPGQHLGEVWLSDSQVDAAHADLRGLVEVVSQDESEALQADSHGTHVAGLMSALRNGEGTVGVVPGLRVKSFPLKVNSTQDGPRISGEDALRNLDALNGALLARGTKDPRSSRVILLSWAFYESDGLSQEFLESFEEKMRLLLDHDVVVVVPSGNVEAGRKSTDASIFPASWAGQFADSVGTLLPVGALDVCGRPAWFSQLVSNELGATLLAPGERIYSTLANNDFGFMSGTSAAAAQVAAVLSLTSQQYQDVDMKTQVMTLLRTSMPVTGNSDRLVSFDAPSFVQGLMSEYGWIARH